MVKKSYAAIGVWDILAKPVSVIRYLRPDYNSYN